MTINDKIISNKLGLLNLAEELGNVSKPCKVMGFSRDTFYRYKDVVQAGHRKHDHRTGGTIEKRSRIMVMRWLPKDRSTSAR